MARDQRRLAAIVSADVVGYSLLMGRDDSATLAGLKAHRQALIDPKIAESVAGSSRRPATACCWSFQRGRRVRCAVDVQRGMAERNAGMPPSGESISHRNQVGDIIIDGDDIFGDGVNVAARLQTLADPGGICVSKVVRDQVLDKLNFAFEDLGAQEVKNIARPVDVYRVDLGSGTSQTQSSGRKRWPRLTKWRAWRQFAAGLLVLGLVGISVWTLPHFWKEAPAPSPPALSVAVVPFSAPAGDADASRFAEALTRYLLTRLPRKAEYGRVLVVSAGSASNASAGAIDPRDLGHKLNVRYVLEGDVLHTGDANAVNLRLVDAATRLQVWSGRETLRDTDVASESSAPLRGVRAAVLEALIDAEEHRVKAQPISGLTAPELVLRAFALGGEDPSLAGLTGAGKLVDEALRLEPDLVPALVLRAALFHDEGEADPDADHDRITREQDRHTARAVQLDSDDEAAWYWRIQALEALGRWNAALEASEIEIKLNPYRGYESRAEIMLLTGRPEEALELVDRALALGPGLWAASTRCEAQLFAGQTEQAIATCERATGREDYWQVHLVLAAAYANHGDMAKAAAAKAEVLRIVPGLTIAQLRAKRRSDNPEYVKLAEQYWYSGLRKAGFPEK